MLLALFVVVWTTFQVTVYSATGIHDDLAEVFIWSQHPSAGFRKHPPLAGLIATAWFSVFPVTDWSFNLLAMVNSAAALFGVDLIARRYLKGDKRLLVLLLLLLTPFYQFHGQRFSTNQTLLSTWPIATYCFLRAFESRSVAWSALAGITTALAMLGKYYSIFLVVAFILAALSHPRRWAYLRSPAPWVSIAAGTAMLAPHLLWLIKVGPEPVQYAMSVHGARSAADEAWIELGYALGGIGYVLIPIAVYLAATRPHRRLVAAALWPADPDRRMLVVLLAVPLLLPMLVAPMIGVELVSLWTMQAWFLLPIVLLGPEVITLTRRAAVQVAMLVGITTAAVLAAAPTVAWLNYKRGIENERSYFQIVGQEMTRVWRAAMGQPLTIVTGEFSLAEAASFYSPDHPDFIEWFGSPSEPWVTAERLRREGWAAVCLAGDATCISGFEAHGGSTRVDRTLSVSFFGFSGAAKEFVFILAPPAAGAPLPAGSR